MRTGPMSADQPSTDRPSAEQPTTCPACGAAVSPGVSWCTLCYADLRPAPEPDPEPAPEPGAGSAAAADPAEVAALADRMLAELAAQPDQALGWVARLPSGKGARAALVVGAVLAASLALVALMFVVGRAL